MEKADDPQLTAASGREETTLILLSQAATPFSIHHRKCPLKPKVSKQCVLKQLQSAEDQLLMNNGVKVF